MKVDWNNQLAEQLDWHWRVQLRSRLDGLRSPAMAVRLGLNAGSRGELVGDGAGVARHGGRGGVDLVDEQGQGAGDAGGAGLFEPDGDGVGGPGDGAGFVVVAQVGVEVG